MHNMHIYTVEDTGTFFETVYIVVNCVFNLFRVFGCNYNKNLYLKKKIKYACQVIYRRQTRYHPPLSPFHPPIISSINEYFFHERDVKCVLVSKLSTHYRKFPLTDVENFLCSWVGTRQGWVVTRPRTV